MNILKKLAASLLAATISAVTPAHSQQIKKTLDDIVAAAKTEGQFTFYTTTADEFVKRLTQGFNAAYPGINVKVLRLASGALHARFATETTGGINVADILDTTSDELHTTHPEWFVELSGTNVPLLSTWPSELKRSRYVMSAQIPHVLVYNTSKTKGPFNSWKDVIDGKFKNDCIQLDPRAAPVYMSFFAMMNQYYGKSFLTAVREMRCQLEASGVPAAQNVAAGGAAIAFPVPLSQATDLIAKGAPIAVVEPTGDGTPVHVAQRYFSLPAKAPHPNAGLLFLLWLLTPDGQKIACGGVYSSPLPNLAECRPLPKHLQAARYDLTQQEQTDVLSGLGLQ